MRLSVIIPTYQRPGDLERLLDSLHKQTVEPEEVLVIIGPNDVESTGIAKKWQQKIVALQALQAKRASVVHALNLGLLAAKNEIICLLDDDVWLPPDWAFKIRTAYEIDEELGAYGGRDYIQSDEFWLSNPPLASSIGVFRWHGGHIGNHHCGASQSPIQVDILKGVNLSFRRSAFMDMQIEPALEGQGAEIAWEIDISQRIALAGFKIVYDNNNYVLHYTSQRLLFDDRTNLFSSAWPSRIFNEALIIAKFRPLPEVFFSMLRAFFIGSKAQPGVIRVLLLIHKYNWRVLRLPWRNLFFIVKGCIWGFQRRHTNIFYLKNIKT